VIDEFRKTRKLDETIVYGEAEDSGNTLNIAEAGLDAKDILNLLNRLDEGQRTVFNLFEIDGYSHAEIGVMTGVSERTSKRYLAAARDNLKEIMAQIYKNEQTVISSGGKNKLFINTNKLH
jgi:RNA polymerase sigma-70 factor (ECF subfamily)